MELAPRGRVAAYLATNSALMGPAGALAPVAAGAFAAAAGYRSLFVVCVVTALVGALLAQQFVREPRSAAAP